jgi:hypothetical protein
MEVNEDDALYIVSAYDLIDEFGEDVWPTLITELFNISQRNEQPVRFDPYRLTEIYRYFPSLEEAKLEFEDAEERLFLTVPEGGVIIYVC